MASMVYGSAGACSRQIAGRSGHSACRDDALRDNRLFAGRGLDAGLGTRQPATATRAGDVARRGAGGGRDRGSARCRRSHAGGAWRRARWSADARSRQGRGRGRQPGLCPGWYAPAVGSTCRWRRRGARPAAAQGQSGADRNHAAGRHGRGDQVVLARGRCRPTRSCRQVHVGGWRLDRTAKVARAPGSAGWQVGQGGSRIGLLRWRSHRHPDSGRRARLAKAGWRPLA